MWALYPDDAEAQARMWQRINVAAHYVFPVTEERLVLPRVMAPLMSRQADETKICEALPVIDYHFQQVNKRLADSRFLAGDAVSLGDLFMYPVIDATCAAPEGQKLVGAMNKLCFSYGEMGERNSDRQTCWSNPASFIAD
ncbi:MAG TPA: hypothetical protein DCS39_02620 [Rhodobiaceae bacterium]|nr:hypothetical protein [Rhodobiaceae bacterium]